MNASMTQNPTTATVNCPVGGCDTDRGPAYSMADPVSGELSRHHEREVLVHDGSGESVSVALSCLETRPGRQVGEDDGLPLFEPLEGSPSTFGQTSIAVHTSGCGVDLTAAEARALIGVLSRKVEELDDLSGSSLDIGSTVAAWREGTGASAEHFAEVCGLSVERLRAVEAGELATHAERHQFAQGAADICLGA